MAGFKKFLGNLFTVSAVFTATGIGLLSMGHAGMTSGTAAKTQIQGPAAATPPSLRGSPSLSHEERMRRFGQRMKSYSDEDSKMESDSLRMLAAETSGAAVLDKEAAGALIQKIAGALSESLASVKDFDISYDATLTGSSVGAPGSVIPLPMMKWARRVVLKNGRWFCKEDDISPKAVSGDSRFGTPQPLHREWLIADGKVKVFTGMIGLEERELAPPKDRTDPHFGTSNLIKSPEAEFMTEYWTCCGSLPKSVIVAAAIREPYSSMTTVQSLVAIRNTARVLKNTEQVDGHACIRIEAGQLYLWFDKDSFVLRRKFDRGDFRFMDYRPLEGANISIPWRIEGRGKMQNRSYQVKDATANNAVSDLFLRQPFHSEAKRVEVLPPDNFGRSRIVERSAEAENIIFTPRAASPARESKSK